MKGSWVLSQWSHQVLSYLAGKGWSLCLLRELGVVQLLPCISLSLTNLTFFPEFFTLSVSNWWWLDGWTGEPQGPGSKWQVLEADVTAVVGFVTQLVPPQPVAATAEALPGAEEPLGTPQHKPAPEWLTISAWGLHNPLGWIWDLPLPWPTLQGGGSCFPTWRGLFLHNSLMKRGCRILCVSELKPVPWSMECLIVSGWISIV